MLVQILGMSILRSYSNFFRTVLPTFATHPIIYLAAMALQDLLATGENARLRSLYHQNILDSSREPVFETFAELVTHIFSLSMALISVTDTEETVYLAGKGLDELGRWPHAQTICSVVALENHALVFPNLTQVAPPRLGTEVLAAAQAANVKFYAGVPLRMPDQQSIGTLCVADQEPRVFSPQERIVLDKVADLIARIMVVRNHCHSAKPADEAYWQEVQILLTSEVSALSTLVQYVVTRSGVHIPVVPQILEPVLRRLGEIENLLDDFSYQGL